ncbi:GNAT family N-acetyltransferase [Nocardia sputi]|uniref:GNAT family N-acetyltransferase n=1 Tax=Nocardia sputi TaxID=2943705 RepID=UPI0020BF500D|nr:GNAT family N-acetyltransferase [Nocardia sputi]
MVDDPVAMSGAGEPMHAVGIERGMLDRSSWWVAPAVELFDTEFGTGYIAESELRVVAAAPTSAVFIVHRDESLLSGVATVSCADDGMRQHFRRTFATLGFVYADGESVGCLGSVVVAPGVRRDGIGNALVRACVQFGRRRRWTAIYAASWLSGTPHQSAGVLARNGFVPVGTIADYWLPDESSSGMSCVVCGTLCRCAALMMRCPLV